MALNRNISDFPDGSTDAGGDILINQSGATRKVAIGTAGYRSAGGDAGNVPILDSNGRVARADGGIPDAFPTASNNYYGTNASGQPGFFAIGGAAIPVWASGNSYGENDVVAASSSANALLYRSTKTNNTDAPERDGIVATPRRTQP